MKITLSITKRIQLSFLAMAIFVILVCFIGYQYIHQLENQLIRNQEDLISIDAINGLYTNWLDFNLILDKTILSRDISYFSPDLNSKLYSFIAQVSLLKNQRLVNQSNITEANQDLLKDLENSSIKIRDILANIQQLVVRNDWEAASDLWNVEYLPIYSVINEDLTTLKKNSTQELKTAQTLAENLQRKSRSFWLIATVIAFLESIILSILVTSSFTNPLKQLNIDVNRILHRDFSPIIPLQHNDEIGEFSRSLAIIVEWLRDSYETLEQRVLLRTRDLERKNLLIQTAAEVSKQITAIQNLDELIKFSVDLIREKFGFLFTGIYRIDSPEGYAILIAATGETGIKIFDSEYKLKVGKEGLVGAVASKGLPMISSNVGIEISNPKIKTFLETKSEICLPLINGDRIFGVLDIHSQHPNAFNDEDIEVLTIISDQLAIAIENTSLVKELSSHLEELKVFQTSLTKRLWRQSRYSEDLTGYEYDNGQIFPLSTFIEQQETRQDGTTIYSIPLSIRGNLIGTIEIENNGEDIPQENMKMLEQIGIRLSQSMETARLYQETQSSAEREKRISELTNRFHESLDIEQIMQTAAKEIRTLLDLSEVEIRLGSPQI